MTTFQVMFSRIAKPISHGIMQACKDEACNHRMLLTDVELKEYIREIEGTSSAANILQSYAGMSRFYDQDTNRQMSKPPNL